MTPPLLTPSRAEAQQWAPDILAELGLVEVLRERGIACDVEVHPATRVAIIAVHGEEKADEYVMVYDPLADAAVEAVVGRVAAFFRATDTFIDGDDPRDPIERLEAGEPLGDDGPCSLQTRVIAEIVAVTSRHIDTVSFNDDGSLDQVVRLYVEAGGEDAARYVGTSLPWEDQRDSTHAVDWIDRFGGLDDWLKSDVDALATARALCDRVVERVSGDNGLRRNRRTQ